MSQPTHLTLALGRPRSQNTKNQNTETPDLSLTVTYRLEPGEADLNTVVEARADELRGAFDALCARLIPSPRPLTAPLPDADEGDTEALEEWRDEDAPDDQNEDDEPDALAEDDEPHEDEPDDRPPTFPGNALPAPSSNGHGPSPDPAPSEPTPLTEPSSRVQQIAARSAAWRAGLSADDLTLLLAQHFGKVRVEQLDKIEAKTFLKALQREEVSARTVALH